MVDDWPCFARLTTRLRPGWRNWQTRKLEVLVSDYGRAGSNPVLGSFHYGTDSEPVFQFFRAESPFRSPWSWFDCSGPAFHSDVAIGDVVPFWTYASVSTGGRTSRTALRGLLFVLHDDAQPSSFFLRPFVPSNAATIAGWVETAEQMRWVAPSTKLPLTSEKVIRWKKPGGQAYVLVSGNSSESSEIMAYGELNPMRQVPTDLWLGHLIVRPDQRGRGVGKTLVLGLLERAFQRYDAHRVVLVVFPDNRAAIECYCRCGFQIIREERHSFVEDGPKHRLLRLEIHARDAISFLPAVDGRRELAVV